MSTTPAFSPMPARSLPAGVVAGSSPKRRRCTFDDLYEQCSDHITEYMASSAPVGRRSRIVVMRSYSSAVSPSSDHGSTWSGVRAAFSTVSTTGLTVPAGYPQAATLIIAELGTLWLLTGGFYGTEADGAEPRRRHLPARPAGRRLHP